VENTPEWIQPKMTASGTYCTLPSDRGLTCLQDDLILLERLSEDNGLTYTNIIFLYRCKACRGFYKYIYSSSYQMRNFDAEEGWFIYSDHCFKVGEKNGAGRVEFPLKEARIYGYKG
jgi:hypothetical protein